jgi:hypothetical protein
MTDKTARHRSKERVRLVLADGSLRILLDHAGGDLLRGGLDNRPVRGNGLVLFSLRGLGLGDVLFSFESGDAAGA